MSARKFETGASLSFGWAATREHLSFLIVLQVSYILIEVVMGVISALVLSLITVHMYSLMVTFPEPISDTRGMHDSGKLLLWRGAI